MKLDIPRIMIAAPSSGSGKTTVFCALLRVLRRQYIRTAAFKCGPDYIDPMFHGSALHTPSHNLDMFLLGRGETGALRTRQILSQYSRDRDIALMEGAMGYYDGIGATAENSAWHIACVTETPAILVVDGKGAAISLAAMLRGFATFKRDSHIAGFILNNVSKHVYLYFKDAIEKETGLAACGYFPPLPEASVASRHLGLVTAGEIKELESKLQLLEDTAQETLDISRILRLAEAAPSRDVPDWHVPHGKSVTIAVAHDEAFCFYYDAALDMLRHMGAKLVPFSPLRSTHLPPCRGVYLGGGYPELCAKALSANSPMRDSIRRALQNGMPCIAECGGFMYLLDSFMDGEGRAYPWCGVIAGKSYMTQRLTRFGYVTLTAQNDTAFCPKGTQIQAHEFHYSDSNCNGAAFTAQKASGKRSWSCIHAAGNILAGYPHMHLCGCPDIAWNFLEACRTYTKGTIQYEN